MGLTFRDEAVSKLAERFLPWAWAGFLIQVVTGLLLFSSEATKMYGNLGFEIKMLLIVVAGINAFVFHTIAYQSVGKWDNDPVAPFLGTRGGIDFHPVVVRIVAAGRWIATCRVKTHLTCMDPDGFVARRLAAFLPCVKFPCIKMGKIAGGAGARKSDLAPLLSRTLDSSSG